jgi:hypothetical protein
MPRHSIISSSTSKKLCPPDKFSFLSGCTKWSSVLVTGLICILFIAFAIILLHDKTLLINGKGVTMIENDLSNKPNPGKHYANTFTSSKPDIKRVGERFEANDPMRSENEGTGTKTSDRLKYDININIRDVDSYRQNPNNISYGEYEYNKNMERVINPLLPPERSYNNTYGIPINIPSRGPFQSYQQIGMLYKENVENPGVIPGNNNETNILPLFGRPTYPGSNRWNYYTSSDKFQSVKLPISMDGRKCTDDLGCNELRDGDMVVIPSYNGRFKVEIYDFDKPRYIPYVY